MNHEYCLDNGHDREVTGVRRQMLGLSTGHLRVEGTRVVVAGRALESQGAAACVACCAGAPSPIFVDGQAA